MPNRQIINGERYRYAYQGQEKDDETGKEAFQLRLWDGRIGRWLSPDPAGQYHSPYLGMGNSPISNVDPDGGIAINVITGAIGAVINAGINIYSQARAGELEWSLKSVGRVALAAGGGFIAGSTGNLAAAAATNGVLDLADQVIQNDGDLSKVNVTKSLITGATSYVGGKLVGGIANRYSQSYHLTKLSNTAIVRNNRKIHQRILYNKVLKKTGRVMPVRDIDNLADANLFETSFGFLSGGLISETNPNDIIGNFIFDKPNLPKIDFKDFRNPFFGMNSFNYLNSFRNNNSGSGLTVGNLILNGVEK